MWRTIFSTITTAPSTTMPKSSAPSDSRFAGICRRSRQIDAYNRENGMVNATISAPRAFTIILFLFLGNARGALIVALTIPFSLLFASICLDLRHIPANLLSLGALDFGMVVDGAVVMVENIVRHMGR